MTERPGDGGGDDRGTPGGDVGGGALPGGLPDAPECPFCRGEETELMNAFGAHASVATYWCRSCRSPFELMRWRRGAEPDADRR